MAYERVVHACYTPLTIDTAPHLKCFVLALLAVLPEYQGRGVGKELMETSIEHLKSISAAQCSCWASRPSILNTVLPRLTNRRLIHEGSRAQPKNKIARSPVRGRGSRASRQSTGSARGRLDLRQEDSVYLQSSIAISTRS
ncbi:GNAT family N-acetyltransferase [Ruegeria sp. SCP10]|uniref:GNAT family N-acetyltransferase n=1 Tax=Ruegeria sp. SCP10 TaxID=3141377 RepID=UPI00333D1174